MLVGYRPSLRVKRDVIAWRGVTQNERTLRQETPEADCGQKKRVNGKTSVQLLLDHNPFVLHHGLSCQLEAAYRYTQSWPQAHRKQARLRQR